MADGSDELLTNLQKFRKLMPEIGPDGKSKNNPRFLYPLIYAGIFAGVRVPDIKKPWNILDYIHILYAICIAGLFAAISVFQCIHFFSLFGEGKSPDLLMKSTYLSFFCGDFFTLVIIIYMLIKSDLFNKVMKKFRFTVFTFLKYVDFHVVIKQATIMYLIYGVLATAVITLVGIAFCTTGTHNPLFISSMFPQYKWSNIKYPLLLFYIYQPLVVIFSWGYVEVNLAFCSCFIKHAMDGINQKLSKVVSEYEDMLEQEELNSLGSSKSGTLDGKIYKMNITEQQSYREMSNNEESSADRKMSFGEDETSSTEKLDETQSTSDNSSIATISEFRHDPPPAITLDQVSTCILESLEDHHTLCDLITYLNKIFGPLILLAFLHYLLVITILSYGLICGHSVVKSVTVDLMLIVNNLNYAVRVFVLIPIFSHVNSASNNFVLTLSRSTTWAPEELVHRMSVYVQQLTNEPVGISAWGFFTITLGTLLTFLGTVLTYLIILVKNDCGK